MARGPAVFSRYFRAFPPAMTRSIPVLLMIAGVAACTSAPDPADPGQPMGEGAQQTRAQFEWERRHDPATGLVPPDIRRKELAFAKTLPHRSDAKSLTWTWRGPRNRGGRTRAFAVDRTDTQRLLAGGVTGGMWLSEDAGITWQKTSAPEAITSSSCIVQDPRTGRDSTWYYGTGENYGVVSGTSFSALLPGDGIFKSTDAGHTWAQLPATIAGDHEHYTRNGSFKQVNGIVVDPTRNDSDVVLAAVYNGIFRSNDGGAGWTPVLGLDTTTGQVSTYSELLVSTAGVYYAIISAGSPSKGVWRSTDGLAWTQITPSGWSIQAGRAVAALDPQGEDTLWVFVNSSANTTQLWRYAYLGGNGSGAGGQWTNKTPNLPNGSCTGYFTFDFGYINTQGGYDMCIAVHPDSSHVVYVGGTSLYRSDNAWSSPGTYHWIGGYQCDTNDPKNYVWPNHHPDQHGLLFDPLDHSTLYSVNDGGVHVTFDPLADSVQWSELNTGYITSQFYTIHLEDGDVSNDRLIGGLQDNGGYLSISDDPNDPWVRVHQDDGAYAALPHGQNFILHSSQQGRLYKKSVDAGWNVTGFERIDPVITPAPNYNFINPFVLDPADNNTLYWVAGTKIYRNNDLAAMPVADNWYTASTSPAWEHITQATLPGQAISTLDISLAAPNTLWCGSKAARIWRVDSLHTAAPLRTELDSPEWPGGAYTSCIAPNDLDADEWLLTFSNYGVKSVWHTTDGGVTWQSVSGNIEEDPDGGGSGPAVFWALIYPTYDGLVDRYFIGTSTGLYSTALLDGDNTVWEQEGPASIGNAVINMIAARNYDGLIAVATHGNGVYSSHLPAAPIGVPDRAVDPAIGIFPNPAVDHLAITFHMKEAGLASVEVVDLGGRTILRKELGRLSAGICEWRWDLRDGRGSRLARGEYVICVRGTSDRSARVVVR